MRCDNNEVNIVIFCHPDDFRGRLPMDYQLLNIEAGAFVAFSEPGQFTLSRIFELFGNVGNWHRFRHSRIANRRYYWFDHIDTDNRSTKGARQRRGVVESIVPTFAEISGKENGTNLHNTLVFGLGPWDFVTSIRCHKDGRPKTKDRFSRAILLLEPLV